MSDTYNLEAFQTDFTMPATFANFCVLPTGTVLIVHYFVVAAKLLLTTSDQ